MATISVFYFCMYGIRIFSRLYLSNGRAIGMSCRPSVCPPVCLSVTDVLRLNGAR